MKSVEYVRKDKVIINVTTGVVETFRSANQAKRASRQIQMETDKRLGCGTVRRQ